MDATVEQWGEETRMAYNRTQARTLCTASEYGLFEASLSGNIAEHSPAQLKSKIERARRTRDKYRDLYQRQRLATRERTGTKKGRLPERNARTEQKARLFDEVLQRLAKRSAELSAQSERRAAAGSRAGDRSTVKPRPPGHKMALTPAARKSKAKRKARGSAGASSARDSGYVSQKAASADRRQSLQKTRSRAVQGHIRASGKRTQARRDRRR
jgi:hypothetical protein